MLINFVYSYQKQKMQKINTRQKRMGSIRQSLKLIPIITANRQKIQKKLQTIERKHTLIVEEDNQMEINTPLPVLQQQQQNMTVFQEKYQMLQKIGQGSNGIVRKCLHRKQKKIYALKSMRIDEEHIYYLKKNFSYIKRLNNEHIINYKSLYIDRKKHTCNLVMEYINQPNLLKMKNLKQSQLKKIMYQLFQSLKYLHKNNICHRDIKPQNILYDQQKQKIKLIDFGISKKLVTRNTKQDMLSFTGTLYYKAPQMFLGGGYDQKVDIWAAGITLYKMVTGVTPFQSEYHLETIDNIIKSQATFEGKIWQNYSNFLPNFISRLLKLRKFRLTADEALKHFWFICSSAVFSKAQLTHSMNIFGNEKFMSSEILSNIRNSVKGRKFDEEDGKFKFRQEDNQYEQYSLQTWLTGINGQIKDLILSDDQNNV